MTINLSKVIAIFLSLMMVFANIVWLVIDDQPQPIVDQYVEKIFNLVAGLQEKSIFDMARNFFWSTLGPRPPLYQILAVPSVMLFGRTIDAILIVNSLSIGLGAICTYYIARRLLPHKYALVAMILIVSFPLQAQQINLVRPHGLVSAFAALFVLQCLRSMESFSIKNAWLLATTFFVSFLIHPSSVYILLGPLLLVIGKLFLDVKQTSMSNKPFSIIRYTALLAKNPVLMKGLVPSFSIALSLVLIWLSIKWQQYLGLKEVLKDIFIPQTSLLDLELEFASRIGAVSTFLFIFGLVILISKVLRCKHSTMELFTLLCFTSMLLMFHTILPFKHWPFFNGSIPIIAITISYAVFQTAQFINARLLLTQPRRIISNLLFYAFFSHALFQYGDNNWGFFTAVENMCLYPATVCGPNNRRSVSPVSGDWQFKPLLQVVTNNTTCLVRGCTLKVVSHRPAYYSDEVLTSMLVKYFDQPSRSNVGSFYPVRNLQISRVIASEMQDNKWQDNDYFVYLLEADGMPLIEKVLHSTSNSFEPQIIAQLSSSTQNLPRFKEIGMFILPNGQTSILVQNISR